MNCVTFYPKFRSQATNTPRNCCKFRHVAAMHTLHMSDNEQIDRIVITIMSTVAESDSVKGAE